jgi:hypothetical protein
MKQFLFQVVLCGYGETPEEAWSDAVEGFTKVPGPVPENHTVESEGFSIVSVSDAGGYLFISPERGGFGYTKDVTVDPDSLTYYPTEDEALEAAGIPVGSALNVRVIHENSKEEVYGYREFLEANKEDSDLIEKTRGLLVGESFVYDSGTSGRFTVALEIKEGVKV